MTSIPADPTLTLGNYVSLERIRHLQEVASALQPEQDAHDNLQELILNNYRFKMIMSQISSMAAENSTMEKAMDSLKKQIKKLEEETIKAAVDLAEKTISCQAAVEELETQFGQTLIASKPESPLDFSAVDIKKFPLSSDSMTFDVQYFKNDTNKQEGGSHSTTVINAASRAANKSADATGVTSNNKQAANSVESMTQSESHHNIEGTLVITANCTHRQADIIAPLNVDPMKLMSAWNQMYPEDYLSSLPMNLMRVAHGIEKQKGPDNKLYLLTGCTRGSSFVGFAHIIKDEITSNEQTNSQQASKLSDLLAKEQMINSEIGNFGVGKNFAKEAASLMSTSNITCHCNLIVKGVIPDISANTMKTTVMQLKPDPKKIMENLSAASAATMGPLMKDSEGEANDAKTKTQLGQMDSSYIANMGQALSAVDEEANQVIDTNSLMTAFTNYISKCEAGESGVPINYYFTEFDKMTVAKEYLKKFYPSGTARNVKDLRAGVLGQAPEGGDK